MPGRNWTGTVRSVADDFTAVEAAASVPGVARVYDELTVVEQLGLAEPKTKALVARLTSFGAAAGPTLLVLGERSADVERAAANVPWLQVTTALHTSVYQLVRHDRVVAERAALVALQEALSR